ncbi:hypothetical protein SAMN04488012_10237 [Palleronia salina]|uniref:CAAX prenyl protease 2/Lysostaphin resistance protein A-like domain-containing protein n=2 Tax=Palleronia salina TaxID=313368 RepID=A0A1M6CG66_9RHOB|nr:hypothetical protein SAMN04488012_10237 [Palleronia salina]
MPDTMPFETFVSPARGRPQIWRLVLGLVICVLAMVLWLAALFGLLVLVIGQQEALGLLEGMAEPTTPRATLLLLATFVGMALGPIVAVKLLHRRRVGSLIGRRGRTVRHFLVALGTTGAIYGLTLAVWTVQFDGEPNLPPDLWLTLLPLALLGVLIQTGAEELLFRGYLLQQLAARFATPLIYMLVPSLLFGMLHFDPATMGANAWAVVGSTAFFGLIAADLTVVTGTIGAAWGLHFANNVVALLLISTKGTITGLALFLTPYAADEVTITGPLLMADLALVSLVWGVLRFALRP